MRIAPILLLLLAALCTAHAERPANIILILADDLGYETLSVNGSESYTTPNLDRLAANGARFEHCYSQPLCTPSRVQIMTGQYNVRNYQKFGILPREETTFAHKLKEQGYATCIAGKWQLGMEKESPQHFGFDEALLWHHTYYGRARVDGQRVDKRYENPILDKNGERIEFNNGEFAPDLMVDFIADFIHRKKDQPFLVYYPMILTHCPFVPTPHSDDWDPTSKGSNSYKGDARYFGDMVEYVDHLVGRIEAELERQGLLENTYIIFTGDNGTDRPVVTQFNGAEYPGRKGEMTNAGTHVPLIVSRPGTIPTGLYDELVDFSDFFPTLCEIAGSDTEALTLDGHSLVSQLHGGASTPRDYIYCWYNRKATPGKTQIFARNQRYKLYQTGKFYDIANDLWEKQPLDASCLSPEQAETKSSLQAVLDHYKQFDQITERSKK